MHRFGHQLIRKSLCIPPCDAWLLSGYKPAHLKAKYFLTGWYPVMAPEHSLKKQSRDVSGDSIRVQ